MNVEAMMSLGKVIAWVILVYGLIATIINVVQYLYYNAKYTTINITLTKGFYIRLFLTILSIFYIVGTWGR